MSNYFTLRFLISDFCRFWDSHVIGDAIPESIDPFDSGHAKIKLKNYIDSTIDSF